jgi:hypothetical protein
MFPLGLTMVVPARLFQPINDTLTAREKGNLQQCDGIYYTAAATPQ